MKTKHHIILLSPVTPSGDQTLNNPIRPRWFALGLGGLLFTVLFALSPSPMQAGCKRWDVSGQWVVKQADGGYCQVNLRQGEWGQTSANLTGTAIVTLKAAQHPGVISGNITENAFTMLITIDTGAQYRYQGTVREGTAVFGQIGGTTDNGRVHWVSSRFMKCVDANPPISKQKSGEASPTPSAEAADESSSTDTVDQQGKLKKKKNKNKHQRDADQDQSND